MREKLIELINNADKLLGSVYAGVKYPLTTGQLTDYLLANGVVVLPCRCCECEHCDIGQNDVEQWCVCTLRFGKHIDVYPTDFCSHAKRKDDAKMDEVSE